MVDKKISELDELVGSMDLSDLIPAVHGGGTVKATMGQALDLIKANLNLFQSINGGGATFPAMDGVHSLTLDPFIMYGPRGEYGQFYGRLLGSFSATTGTRKYVHIQLPTDGRYFGASFGVGVLRKTVGERQWPCFLQGESSPPGQIGIYMDSACVEDSGLFGVYFQGHIYFSAE